KTGLSDSPERVRANLSIREPLCIGKGLRSQCRQEPNPPFAKCGPWRSGCKRWSSHARYAHQSADGHELRRSPRAPAGQPQMSRLDKEELPSTRRLVALFLNPSLASLARKTTSIPGTIAS